MDKAAATTVKITVDGATLTARAGEALIEVLRREGIKTPALCYHPDLSRPGSCRACLVEIEGMAGEVPSCKVAVQDGMQVRAETPELRESHRSVLEMLLNNYIDTGTSPTDLHESEFAGWCREFGLEPVRPDSGAARFPTDADPHPAIRVDLNKCILCTRCIRACAEIQGRFVWGVGGRSDHSHIVAGLDQTMLEARCESCGACAAYCPTGALADRGRLDQAPPDQRVMTTCSYCGVGCNFDLEVRAGRITGVASNAGAPVNGMHLCVKGRYGYDFIHHAERLTRPRVREWLLQGTEKPAGTDRGPWVEVDWDRALELVAGKLAGTVTESGPDAVAVFSSAKCTNEENYLMQKFARQVIGTHNVDHCARLCHSSTVAGLAAALGSGAMTNTMADIAQHAKALLVIGSNTTEQHPVFGSMLRRAVIDRGVKLIVADPRRIELTEFACLHLQHEPGTDIALVNGLMHLILSQGWQDQGFIDSRTEGFQAFRASLAGYTPEHVSAITRIPVAQLHEAAAILGQVRPMAVIWAMGITQHTVGVQNVFALANLQLLTGNLGLPGSGVNPLRGQNNVQGACDMGALPNVFPGYQQVTNADARAKFAAAWSLGNRDTLFSDATGLTVTEMVDQAEHGGIRALYILGENTLMTEPDLNHTRRAMAAAQFTVLQEIFPTATAEYADVLLPGASFAEKDGTYTNTERRVQMINTAVAPPGEARPDWAITADLARRVLRQRNHTPTGDHAGWDYDNAAQIMAEIAALTPSYGGINHARLLQGEQLHWPCPAPDHAGTPILHTAAFTRGKGLFHITEHLPAQELPDEDYPWCLTTGRVLYHWHGAEMTRRSRALTSLYPESLLEIAREDGERIGLNGRTRVRVISRRGEMTARAQISERVPPGLVFGNFHFPEEANINNVTIAAVDPVAKIPEYKVCAVRIEAVD